MPSLRILYAEDDQDSCEMIKAYLAAAGYELITANTAADGLSKAKAEKPDVIILDNWYPEGSGIELCRKIRTYDKTTPIIFYTGAGLESDIINAVDAGAQGYVVKPYVDNLLVEVERLTQRLTTLS